MKRRLTLAILGTVVLTLVLAGLMTLAFAAIEARRSTERDLRQQVVDSADGLRELSEGNTNAGPVLSATRQQAILRALRRTLRLEGAALMVFGPAGNTADAPPEGISASDLRLDELPPIRTSWSAGITGRSCGPRPRSSTPAEEVPSSC